MKRVCIWDKNTERLALDAYSEILLKFTQLQYYHIVRISTYKLSAGSSQSSLRRQEMRLSMIKMHFFYCLIQQKNFSLSSEMLFLWHHLKVCLQKPFKHNTNNSLINFKRCTYLLLLICSPVTAYSPSMQQRAVTSMSPCCWLSERQADVDS